jgi:hypothetical protein
MKTYQTYVLPIFLILSLSTIANAQRPNKREKVQGFIINNKQDTIHGLIEIENYITAETRVKFTERQGKDYRKPKTYKPQNIKGYGIKIPVNNNSTQVVEKWVSYVSKKVEESPKPFVSKIVFLERKEMGIYNLYSYHVQSNADAKSNLYFILEKANTGQMIKVTEDNFDEVTSNSLNNCNNIRSRLGRADFSYLNLDRIIYAYNRCAIEAEIHGN